MKKISNLSKKFGSFIRELRIRNSIGQRALAKKIGIAASYLNDIEKNKRSAPRMEIIKKLSLILEADIDLLYDLAGISKKSIAQRVNADLSNNYGNLIQRVTTFVNKNCNGIVENKFDNSAEDNSILEKSIIKLKNYQNYMNNQELDKALKEVFELLTEINIYVDKQAPWQLKKNNIKRMNVVLSVSINLIKKSTFMLFPIIPSSCIKVFDLLNIDYNKLNFKNINIIPSKSFTIKSSEPIFPRIDVND